MSFVGLFLISRHKVNELKEKLDMAEQTISVQLLEQNQAILQTMTELKAKLHHSAAGSGRDEKEASFRNLVRTEQQQ